MDAADVTSRDASIITSAANVASVFPVATGTDKEYTADGPEPFDIDMTPFYA